jgi:hypothetical protein
VSVKGDKDKIYHPLRLRHGGTEERKEEEHIFQENQPPRYPGG